MSEVNKIEIINTSIPRINIFKIPPQTTLPTNKQITNNLSIPAIEMPCVKVRKDGIKSAQLIEDDPDGNYLINCKIPSFKPMQYNAVKSLPIKEEKLLTPNNTPEVKTPEVPEITEEEKIECPDPKKNNPRIGDLNSAGTEKVTGFKLIEEECVVLWTPTTKVEKYLPSLNTISTTFAITIVATTAATLTPFLNKILKPLFKQIINRVKKLIGKKGTRFTGKKPIKSKINKV